MKHPIGGYRLFYGWWIAAASFGILFAMAGTGFYSFSVLLKPLMNEFGWSRGVVSLAQSIYLLTAGGSGWLVGKLIERYSITKIILLGGVVGGACWLLLSLTTSLWYLYTFYFFLGVGLGGAASLVPVMVIISNWFVKKRGIAMGIATSGIALGAMVISPLVGIIVESYGFRMAYVFLGLVVLAIDIPLSLLVLKTGPREMGLLPDNARPSETERDVRAKLSGNHNAKLNRSSEHGTQTMWLKSLPLWLLCLGFTLAQIGEMSIVLHEVAFITDMGISTTAAAAALGFTGGMGGVGKIVFGWLTDRISVRYVAILCFILQLVGVLILMQTHTMAMIWLFVILFGFAMGGMPTLLPIAIGDLFGLASFGVIYGFAHFIVIGLSTVGPPFAGFIYDATGSYSIVFVTFAIAYAVSLITVYLTWGPNPRPIRSLRKI